LILFVVLSLASFQQLCTSCTASFGYREDQMFFFMHETQMKLVQQHALFDIK